MSEIQPFDYSGRRVRTVLIDGDPWFVAADVCEILGYSRARNALRMLDEDDLGAHLVSGDDGRERPAQVVSEAGLYDLILRSERAEAKAFKHWVTHDVLPQIRRTGSYAIPAQRPALPDITTSAGVLVMAEQFAATARALVAAEQRNAELEPAAKSWTQLATANGDFSVADAAKLLSRDPNIKLGRDRLFTVLRELRWCYRQDIDARHRPYQTAIESGRLSELPCSHYHPRTGELVLDPPQVRVTVKGLGWLHQHLGGTAPLAIDGGAA